MAENIGSKENKATGTLLREELSPAETVMLGQMTQHGGYKVLVKLMDALCTRATQDVVRLEPEDKDYERKLSVRSQRARTVNETCSVILKSIDAHVQSAANQEEQEQKEAVDSVAKVFGIHPVPPKPKK
jgi:hypothetical protein